MVSAGVVFVGGFSYADVLDSAKGWAGTIRCNKRLADAFSAFYNRCASNTRLQADTALFAAHPSSLHMLTYFIVILALVIGLHV